MLKYFKLVFLQLQLVKNLCKMIIISVNYERKKKGYIFNETPYMMYFTSFSRAGPRFSYKRGSSGRKYGYYRTGRGRHTATVDDEDGNPMSQDDYHLTSSSLSRPDSDCYMLTPTEDKQVSHKFYSRE